MKWLFHGLFSTSEGMWQKIVLWILTLFTTILYEVLMISVFNASPNIYKVWTVEMFLLNFSIYIYFAIMIVFAMNKRKLFDSYVSEEQIWMNVYELINFNWENSLSNLVTRLMLLAFIFILMPFTITTFWLTSIIVKRKGRNWAIIKILCVFVEICFLAQMIPTIQILLERTDSYGLQLSEIDRLIEQYNIYSFTIIIFIIRFLYSCLKIKHVFEWERESYSYQASNPNIKKPRTISIVNSPNKDISDCTTYFKNCPIWFLDFAKANQIGMLKWKHSYWLKWIIEWYKQNWTWPVCKEVDWTITAYWNGINLDNRS